MTTIFANKVRKIQSDDFSVWLFKGKYDITN